MSYTEADWKLFRKKLPDWQEHYMEKIVEEYTELLTSDKIASDKFWTLEKKIWKDKKKTGVIADMRRSRLIDNLVSLVLEDAITLDDLKEFSEGLQETVQMFVRR